MKLVRVRAETPTGELVDGQPVVRLELVCGCFEVRRALLSPLTFRGNRVHHDCPRAEIRCAALENKEK